MKISKTVFTLCTFLKFWRGVQGWTFNFGDTRHSGMWLSKCTCPDQLSLAQNFPPLVSPAILVISCFYFLIRIESYFHTERLLASATVNRKSVSPSRHSSSFSRFLKNHLLWHLRLVVWKSSLVFITTHHSQYHICTFSSSYFNHGRPTFHFVENFLALFFSYSLLSLATFWALSFFFLLTTLQTLEIYFHILAIVSLLNF